MIRNGYWAFAGFEKELGDELQNFDSAAEQMGRLFISSKPLQKLVWAQLSLPDCKTIEITSITDAAKKLKSMGKRWASAHENLHRRAELIQQQVFNYKPKPLAFLESFPTQDWGFWTLLSENKILAASQTGSSFPAGEITFQEDKENSPSRAYLKLWEVFTVHRIKPKRGERVLDLGSSPGGWTWVLQQLGCEVISVDKADLDPRVAGLKNVKMIRQDAFKIKPADVGPIDWLFSDLICYPPKLYELVQMWKSQGHIQNFVCTIKFQGSTDFETMKLFAAIPGSRIVHLCHNKHEVTWILTKD